MFIIKRDKPKTPLEKWPNQSDILIIYFYESYNQEKILCNIYIKNL